MIKIAHECLANVKEEIKHGGIDIQKSKPKDMNVAVLFTDIVNFTQLSEKMNPSDVLVLLSDYQSIMVVIDLLW